MHAEQIEDMQRRLREAGGMTEDQMLQTLQDATTDPDVARGMIQVLFTLSGVDPALVPLVRSFLDTMLMELIWEHIKTDQNALQAGAKLQHINNLFRSVVAAQKQAKTKTKAAAPRGKLRTTKTA